MSTKHGDIPNAYIKAEKETHLRVYLQLPRGMIVSDVTLGEHGSSSAKELLLDLRKSQYGLKKAGRPWIQLLHTNIGSRAFGDAKATCACIGSPMGRI